MAHKYVIKRYKEPEIILSSTLGEAAQKAWVDGAAIIPLPDNITISAASISAIEETTKNDDVYKEITSGLKEKVEPLLNDQGEVLVNWYKTNVGSQAYEKQYAAFPWYYKLISSDNSIWVAMRLPEYSGIYERSHEVVKCDEDESKLLNRMMERSSHA